MVWIRKVLLENPSTLLYILTNKKDKPCKYYPWQKTSLYCSKEECVRWCWRKNKFFLSCVCVALPNSWIKNRPPSGGDECTRRRSPSKASCMHIETELVQKSYIRILPAATPAFATLLYIISRSLVFFFFRFASLFLSILFILDNIMQRSKSASTRRPTSLATKRNNNITLRRRSAGSLGNISAATGAGEPASTSGKVQKRKDMEREKRGGTPRYQKRPQMF